MFLLWFDYVRKDWFEGYMHYNTERESQDHRKPELLITWDFGNTCKSVSEQNNDILSVWHLYNRPAQERYLKIQQLKKINHLQFLASKSLFKKENNIYVSLCVHSAN